MKLYTSSFSHNSRRVAMLIKHLGLDVELCEVNLLQGESRSPEYLGKNPFGGVPALEDGDFVLTESNAILQYLASQTPNTLWPEDTRLRAEITRWQFWQTAQFGLATYSLMVERMLKPMRGKEPDASKIEEAEARFRRAASIMEKYLSQHDYLVGDALTLADISLAVDLTYASATNLPLEEYPHIQAWFARISALPAWEATQPQFG
ncbi:MAG: glutathione S-transferase family protein [Myxococcales bacterium]|nr:glutathione S-transferase family protein [Myxococcales bacterium]